MITKACYWSIAEAKRSNPHTINYIVKTIFDIILPTTVRCYILPVASV
jgi:hypothetical protein